MVGLVCSVSQSILRVTSRSAITTNGNEQFIIEFAFASDWDEFVPYAIFDKDDVRLAVKIENNACVLPNEMVETVGLFTLGCYGLNAEGDIAYATTKVNIKVVEGASPSEDAPSTPTPSVWDGYILQMEDILAQAKEAAKGKKGDDGKSAYEIAVDGGFEGGEEAWLASLVGEDGSGFVTLTDIGLSYYKGTAYELVGEIRALNLPLGTIVSGGVYHLEDLPDGIMNAELTITLLKSNVTALELYSSNVSPYRWFMVVQSSSSSATWKEYVQEVSADLVEFEDGDTFQDKYDAGELKGSDGVGIVSVELSDSYSTPFYSFQTEVNGQYYLDVIPDVGDTSLNIYGADFSLLVTDGVCSMLTIGSTSYLRVDSSDANLTICRWSDSNDTSPMSVYTVTYSDGTTSTFTVKNGVDGIDGTSQVTFRDWGES